MLRTTLRSRTSARSLALGTLLLVAASGCGGSGQEDGAGTPSEGPGITQEGGDGAEEDPAEGPGASDDGGDAAPDDGADGSGGDAAGTAEPLPAEADLATEQLPVPAEEAVEIGVEAAGGGDLVQIQIDHDDDRWEWELEIVADGTQHELDIDATTGEVTQHDRDEDDDRDPAIDVTSPLAHAEALEIAVGEVPGRVSAWELGSDDGVVRYQVEIDRSEGGDDVEVEIDVETGEVRVDD